MSTFSNKKRIHWFWRFVLGLCTSGILIVAIVSVFLICTTPEIPSFNTIKQAHQPSDALLLDRHDEILHRLRVNFKVRRNEWTSLNDISPAMVQALLVSEDKRFHEHFGVDIKAIIGALINNISHANARGASTITMQLVGLFDSRIAPSGKRTLWQKMQQATAAALLEREWGKEQILEAYLNSVAFKGDIVGIAAMSEGLFGKHPNGLNNREAAIAAAMIRSPNASSKTIARRACVILDNMKVENAQQECEQLDDFLLVRFNQPRPSPSQGIAPHLAQKILRYTPDLSSHTPLQVRTTLDAQIQQVALNSLHQHLLTLENKHVEDGAIIVLDNATGEVIAWVGSSGTELSQAAELDAIMAMRQPGSTLKPFLYGQAIEQKRLTAASLLHDSPLNLNVGNGLYVPQNYDRSYKGWVSVRTSLASSLNIPTVRTLVMVSPSKFAHLLRSLGLPLQESGDYYGYSLALGSAEVTLLSLTNAYRALANQGTVSSIRWLPEQQKDDVQLPPSIPTTPLEIPTKQTQLNPATTWIISSILSDREARVSTFGLNSVLNTRYWSAVKTGTSKDMRDNWAIGYSARYTVGVWVGNASGDAMWGVSGTSGATPIWQDVMNALYEQDVHRGLIDQWAQPTPPEGVVQSYIHYEPAIEPDRQEWFLEGTQIKTIKLASAASNNLDDIDPTAPAQILAPTSGTIIALDPDIPPANQQLRFRSNHTDIQWQIGTLVLGKGAILDWLPIPGRHRITIHDANGVKLDSIELEVRGASVKP